jgi:hypothetical protein
VGAYFWLHRWLSSHLAWKKRWWLSFLKALIPFMRASPSCPDHLILSPGGLVWISEFEGIPTFRT